MTKLVLKSKHRVMCGDSTMIDDVDKLMNGEKADMVFTSPPYNSGGAGYVSGLDRSGNKRESLYNTFKDNFKTQNEFMTFLIDSLSFQSKHVSIVNINYNANDRTSFIDLASKGLGDQKLVETFCWKKSTAMPTPSTITRVWEPVFIFSDNPKLETNQKRDELRNNFIEISNTGNSKKSKHNASFPVELPEHFIKMFDHKTVYEPFCGSGSTLIACEKTNRKCYGMELDEKYCDVIIKRFQDFTKKEAVLESSGQTYNSLLESR